MTDERKVPRRNTCSADAHVWPHDDAWCACGEFTRDDWNNPDVSRVTFDEDAPTVPCIVTDDSSPGIEPICTCPATSEYDPPCAVHGVLGIGVRGDSVDAFIERATEKVDDERMAIELQELLDSPVGQASLRPHHRSLLGRVIRRLKR